MLLGMYRCTDIPGKFVWQPGSLTQAVSKGYWILLEDIDHAPLDVVGGECTKTWKTYVMTIKVMTIKVYKALLVIYSLYNRVCDK